MSDEQGSTILLNTAAQNKAKHAISDHKRTETARTTQARIGRPNTDRHIQVTGQDIVSAEDAFGPERGSVRKASDMVGHDGLVPVPVSIMAHCRKITLCVDVMKVSKMPFLISISRAIKFGTVAWLKNAKADAILKHIKDAHKIHVKRGFILEIVEADGQFEPLRGDLAEIGITLNEQMLS